MSIAALHQVFDETRRLAIAGSNLAAGDFRLKKLIPTLQKSGEKAPVFAKVAEGVERLIDASPKDSASALLDLSSLVMAILYTQGELGGKGPIKPIKTIGIPLTQTQTPARLLKPVIEALTTGGTGRLETIREAHRQGVFQDPRLVNYAITALNDRYGELADLMEKIVGDYGPSIVPLIEETIAIKGKSGDARRLRILHRLAPEKARPIVLDAFENGSKETKLAAVSCLGEEPGDLNLLMQQVESRQREVRELTYNRLALFDQPEVNELLVSRLKEDEAWQVATAMRERHSKSRMKKVIELLNESLSDLQPLLSKSKLSAADKKLVDERINRFLAGWSCFTFRKDAVLQKFAKEILDRWDELLALRGKYSGGSDLIHAIATWSLDNGKPAQVSLIASHHMDAPEELLGLCLQSATQSYPPATVYEEFSPLYRANAGEKASKKQGRKTAREKLEHHRYTELRTAIQHLGRGSLFDEWHPMTETEPAQKKGGVRLDSRWLDDFVEYEDVEMLIHSVSAKDRAALDFLAERVAQNVRDNRIEFEDQWIAFKLSSCNYRKRCDVVTMLLGGLSEERDRIRKRKGYHYFPSVHWITKAVDLFSSNEHKKLQAVLTNIDETLVDELMPYVR
ncbi:hypothetical protein [Rhodopirellula sallentina]|uniref:HEAT repeat domain-containing protein n=1 Tax=Rhodopirellula sallentina SM41 TaxID=1263870 RepID=M5UFC7_9BACT|nr:hypothetical protein [Rhodopirellula sallentina]EMI54688.1 hypothetical protein RSSM_03804 [Rhodopirellula sallentina SM41]